MGPFPILATIKVSADETSQGTQPITAQHDDVRNTYILGDGLSCGLSPSLPLPLAFPLDLSLTSLSFRTPLQVAVVVASLT